MTDAPTTELLPSDGNHEEIDPELLDLPDPPKRERTLTVVLLVLTAFASLAMVFALRRDAAFAFTPTDAVDVGDLGSLEKFVDNRLVRGEVMLGAAHAIRYERPLSSDSFRLMPVAGRPSVWVELRVPAGAESMRWVPPSQVAGRLVRFEVSGPKHRGLAAAVSEATHQDVPEGSWLLVDGESPDRARWAVVLVLMFTAFAAWNLFACAKLLRRVGAS